MLSLARHKVESAGYGEFMEISLKGSNWNEEIDLRMWSSVKFYLYVDRHTAETVGNSCCQGIDANDRSGCWSVVCLKLCHRHKMYYDSGVYG